jgi:hypothetical protein
LDAEDSGPAAVLQVVRYFNDGADQQAPFATEDARAEEPDLFGWHLNRGVLDFLQATGAVLDVDEYDMTSDYADEQPGS